MFNQLVKYSTLPFSFTFNLMNPKFRSMVFHQNEKALFTNDNDPKEYTKKCIDSAISWIIHQQSLQADGGMAGYVSFSFGSLKISRSYPETVGYTIITLLDYASLFNSRIAYDSALKMAEFELKIQNSNGSFNGGLVGDIRPSVFNSAQIADGLLKAYTASNDRKYLDAALSVCRWISSVQDDEGSWSRFNFLGMKRVYDTKVSQTLLKADNITGNNEFGEVVEKNINWVISNQNEKGWFNNCDNTVKNNNSPLTHTIGYTTHGLIECYLIQKNRRWLEAAIKPLTTLSDQFETTKKPLSARFFSDWTPAARSSCITGNSQISICWFHLYDILGDSRYLKSALELNNFLKSIQFISPFKEISGAVPSSFPIYGDYHPYTITNWTVKYYADSLISEYRVRKTL
jgi:prenyltransferase beta subunit